MPAVPPPVSASAALPHGAEVAGRDETGPFRPHRATAPQRPARTERDGFLRRRRTVLWVALVALLAVAQSMLVWLTLNYERTRAQEAVETATSIIVADVRRAITRDVQGLQAIAWNEPDDAQWQTELAELLRTRRELLRIERRSVDHRILEHFDSPHRTPIFAPQLREQMDLETELGCAAATRIAAPTLSRSYFVPQPDGMGVEVVDICVPLAGPGRTDGYLTGTLALVGLLTENIETAVLRAHEVSFTEGDRTRVARAGLTRGGGVYVDERLIDMPGQSLRLRVDSIAGDPRLIPNLAVALVLGLSLALGAVVVLLVRDVRRRANTERALAEALAFRKAMEDSLITGLRARDLDGRVSYVNPAFSRMVGFSADELIGRTTPPYWPPEMVAQYQRRQAARQSPAPAGDAGNVDSPGSSKGFETLFMRSSGERFAVMIFEAPLVDRNGVQTGWMSTALDVSDQRRVEELSRQQQERLQATARLATVGEMASLLSHELNQPLSAISSYATGSLNLMRSGTPDAETADMLRQAAERIAEQAERAGRVIKSVHDFVRRRVQLREPVRVDTLLDAVLPLVRLQARKSGTRVEVETDAPLPRVVCDRTMVEQVLLNLTRNGIQAMEEQTPVDQRVLLIRVRSVDLRWLRFSIIDRGQGVSADVAQRLFTPFFTTRSEGMGLGLSLCRTVIEQHGGALDFENLAGSADAAPTTEFRFTLPAEQRGPSRVSSAESGRTRTDNTPTEPAPRTIP